MIKIGAVENFEKIPSIYCSFLNRYDWYPEIDVVIKRFKHMTDWETTCTHNAGKELLAFNCDVSSC